jgi:hypothetical protein
VSIRPLQWYVVIKIRNKKPNEVLGFSEGIDTADAVRNLVEQAGIVSTLLIFAAPWPSKERPEDIPSYPSMRA